VRYQPKAFARLLVPEALENIFTVLRSPIKHFRSSFQYWGIATHISANNGPSGLRWDQFLRDPYRYWEFLNTGDVKLIYNNMAFDLGVYEVWCEYDVNACSTKA